MAAPYFAEMNPEKKDLKNIHIYSPFANALADDIRKRFPDSEIVSIWGKDEFEKHIDEMEVLLCFRPPKDLLARAPRINWIMSVGAGVDSILPNSGLRKECVITNARGIHAAQISEYVMGVMLALALRLPEHIRNQSNQLWQLKPHTTISGKRMAVIGLGSIGKEIARKASALGLRVIGVKKHPAPVEHVERVYGQGDLHQVLSEADFVVLIVALTPETRGLIGKAELQAMKPDAFLINVARGSVVVENDLVEALTNGTIAGAALDVFEKEPLPPESPLWKMENVLITPHNAGIRPDYFEAVAKLFCDNLERYLFGQPMFNVVDREQCY
jgi:phosphoglycerate dehydrogenase-like enzyme